MPEQRNEGSYHHQGVDNEQYIAKLRSALSKEVVSGVRKIAAGLEEGVLAYLVRPESDPELIGILDKLVGHLGIALRYGQSTDALPKERLLDVKAGLVGAGRVLDPAEEFSALSTPSEVSLAARFLDLTRRRVGIFDQKTGESEIRARLSPQAASRTVKHKTLAPDLAH